jgi:fucose 4-O-acetylase-like acetyltransferase
MENQIQTSKRIEWIDTAKGIGLLLVMLGHLHVPYMSAWIYTFHMPLFFFLSGVVFSGDKYSFKEFCIKRMKSLVVPYFCLGFVIYLFYVIMNVMVGPENGLYGTNMDMLKNFLIQEHFWTIWFLACLFVVEIMWYWIWKIFSRWLVAPVVVSVGICIIGLLRYRLGYGSLPWNFDVALVAQFFFYIGYCFKCSRQIKQLVDEMQKNTYLICAAIMFLINVVAGFLCIRLSGESLDMSIGMYGKEVLTILSALAGTLFVVLVSKKVSNKFLTYLGQNTMVLFAWHSRILIELCGYIYKSFGLFQGEGLFERVVYSVVTLIIILVVLIPINEVIKKSKLHFLFGVGRV